MPPQFAVPAAEGSGERSDRLESAIDITSLGIWEWDVATDDVYWSGRQREIFGVSPDEPVNYAVWASRLHPEDSARVQEAAAKLLDPGSGGQMHLQHRLMLPAGEVRWIESHGRMLYEQGRPVKLLGTVTDITARKQSEQTLIHSLAALDLALDAADATPWQYNIRTREILWSPRVATLLHIKAQSHYPTLDDFLAHVHPDDREKLLAVREKERAAGPGEKHTLELRLRRFDGTWIWIERRSVVGPDEPSGRWVIGVDLDITSRKRASEALAVERERLAAALLTGRLGVYQWQAGEDTIWWSREVYPVYGVSPDTFTPTLESFTRLVHPDDREGLWRRSEESLRTRTDFDHEYRIVRPDGMVRWISNRSRVSVDPESGRERIIGVAADVTERRQHEEHIKLLMREVNHRSKNLLAVVQAMAAQSARVSDPELFSQRFSERLQGLAASHDLLVRDLWQSVDLADLLRSQLSHFSGLIGSRVRFNGPPFRISASAAQSIGMALHELTTNAAKYGALSVADGLIEVTWKQDGGIFELTWEEFNGPPLTVPQKVGFGTAIMTRILERSLDGKVVLSLREGRVFWSLQADIQSVV